ncbi:rhodanese-like domain-containing protein [Akkermansiaceae bacterium]|nr:rhodanese-like domain-containing protein [Akkermansiaceae bacterium]
MKRFISGALVISLLSLGAASLMWWISGPPDRSVPCDVSELEGGYVCLKTVLAWEADSYLWVDARPREIWKDNGIAGSVLLTDDSKEDYFSLIDGFMTAVSRDGDIYPKVVIYCNETGCKTSHSIAKQLREEYAVNFGFEVYVLHGGWKALAAEGLPRTSTLSH